jgi:hypothetical protein
MRDRERESVDLASQRLEQNKTILLKLKFLFIHLYSLQRAVYIIYRYTHESYFHQICV